MLENIFLLYTENNYLYGGKTTTDVNQADDLPPEH
jgi:hypothetical protein